jgi:hypothetical protein
LDDVRLLENLSAELGRALAACDWARVETLIADSRRTMHSLQNHFENQVFERDEIFNAEIFTRLRAVGSIRGDQMNRLAFYNGALRERLSLLGRAKSATRGFGGAGRRQSPLGSLDHLS